MVMIKHFPAIQVLLPLITALVVSMPSNRTICWLSATFGAYCNLIFSVVCLWFLGSATSYNFGDFSHSVGIEFKIDRLNQSLIVFSNFILVFFLTFGRHLINRSVLNYIGHTKQRYLCSILFFAHTGYLGLLSTNDLFNLYVFIEISSLATYILVSNGKNPLATVGAFDYLILGTIGATLILIGIGFFLAVSGNLNLSDVLQVSRDAYPSKTFVVAIVFIFVGIVLKIAFFPMHFWMIRAYSASAPFILTYVASISSLVGCYILVRFIVIPFESIIDIWRVIIWLLRPFAIVTIIVCTFLALRAKDLRQMIVYSAASQVGFAMLLIVISVPKSLVFTLITLDSISKMPLFALVSYIEHQIPDTRFSSLDSIVASKKLAASIFLCLLFSAGCPLTSMFSVKTEILEALMGKGLWLELLIVLCSSTMTLLYHVKFGSKLLLNASKNSNAVLLDDTSLALAFMAIVQFLSLIYIDKIQDLLTC